MFESLFRHTSDLPEERLVTVAVEGPNGYNLNGALRGLRAYQPAPLGQLWEYRFIESIYQANNERLETQLNEMGRDGWELVNVEFEHGRAIFKRPK